MNENTNDFYNDDDLKDIDKQITETLSRPTLVGKMKAEKKKSRILNMLEFWADVEKYWYVYVFLVVSAIFTGTLGIYMGLSPKLIPDQNVVFYNTDFSHIVLAIVYCIAFVTITEAAFAIMKWLFFTREENNETQKWMSVLGMVIAGLSILGTGIAGGTVIASNIAFLTDFVQVPDAAQKWVVIAIPTLVTIYTFLVSAYSLSSDHAASERLTREQARESELDHKTRLRLVEQIGAQRLQVAEIKRYQQLVELGRISAAAAQAAMRAGRTLGQEEIRQNRDIDGQGGIGNRGGQSAIRTMPRPRPQVANRQYSMDDFLKAMDLDPDSARAMLDEYGLRTADDAWRTLRQYGQLPEDLTHRNFNQIFEELTSNSESRPPAR